MAVTVGTRPHTGGPPRQLALASVNAELARLKALPPSTERTRQLRRCRSQLTSIANRSGRNGA